MPAKKKATAKSSTPKTAASSHLDYGLLVAAIHSASEQAVHRAAVAVNQWLVIRNWLVGAYLVEYEQNGSDRAKYGAKLLERLAGDLAELKIKGLDVRTLRDCRKLFTIYPQIRGPLDPEFGTIPLFSPIRGPVTPESEIAKTSSAPTPLSSELLSRFSWTQLRELMVIDDPWKRAFYENEILKGHWSKRQLQRQIESLLYERTGLSTDKKTVIERARKQEPQESIEDLIRDPYILEFAGLADRPAYSENDLETALLDHLQRFLLELGNGFCFEARQFRITTGNRHHRVDLVFYHRLLRCHVLIDLKIRAFKHEDAGQMNFYVNWFKEHQMLEGDHPPVGIILCSSKDHTDVEFATAGMDAKLFVSAISSRCPARTNSKPCWKRIAPALNNRNSEHQRPSALRTPRFDSSLSLHLFSISTLRPFATFAPPR
jgi:predicted nuclease of restriction endonuclease-like (RecB) superfamily